MRKSLGATLIAVAIIGGSAGVYCATKGNRSEPQVSEAPVTRGDIIDSVGATGALQAVTTVQVGTQVSGTISDLYADFNSIVRKGQVIARLDTVAVSDAGRTGACESRSSGRGRRTAARGARRRQRKAPPRP